MLSSAVALVLMCLVVDLTRASSQARRHSYVRYMVYVGYGLLSLVSMIAGLEMVDRSSGLTTCDGVVDVKLVGMSNSTGGSPQLTRTQTAPDLITRHD